MTSPLLHCPLRLGEGDAQIRRQKERIVSEAALASRGLENLALRFATKRSMPAAIDDLGVHVAWRAMHAQARGLLVGDLAPCS